MITHGIPISFLSRLCLNINFAPVPLKLYRVSLLMVHCWSFSFANLVAPKGAVFWLWVLLTFSVPTRRAIEIRAAFQQLCGGLLFSLVLLPTVEQLCLQVAILLPLDALQFSLRYKPDCDGCESRLSLQELYQRIHR